MAERINPAGITFRRGAPSKYPWDEWTDGSMWHLKQGVDYQSTTKIFRDTIYNVARRRGRKVHTRELEDGIVITFPQTDHPLDTSRIRYFLSGADLRRVISFTQNEIDELPTCIYGLTEMQLIPVERKAVA